MPPMPLIRSTQKPCFTISKFYAHIFRLMFIIITLYLHNFLFQGREETRKSREGTKIFDRKNTARYKSFQYIHNRDIAPALKKTTSFTSKIRWFEHHQSSRYNKNWVHEFQNLNWNTHKSSKKSTKRLHPTFTSNMYPQWRQLQLRLVNLYLPYKSTTERSYDIMTRNYFCVRENTINILNNFSNKINTLVHQTKYLHVEN